MLTAHAESRCQQRGIRPEIVQTILSYGRRQRRHGADVCYMDHRARKQAELDLGHHDYSRIESKLSAYLVVADDGALITAGHRLRRLKF